MPDDIVNDPDYALAARLDPTPPTTMPRTWEPPNPFPWNAVAKGMLAVAIWGGMFYVVSCRGFNRGVKAHAEGRYEVVGGQVKEVKENE